eukprot:6492381-Karenia_brevis.AAC.1
MGSIGKEAGKETLETCLEMSYNIMDRFLHGWEFYDVMFSNGYDLEYICELDDLARTMSKHQPVDFEQRSYMHGERWHLKFQEQE